MEEKKSIENFKEVLHLVFAIVIPILKKRKEAGKFEPAQLLEFLNSEEFKAAIEPAIKDIGEIGAEFKDFGFDDGLELASFLLVEAKKIGEIYK